MTTINKTQVRELLDGIKHTSKAPFKVTFNKRSTGEKRVMIAKYGVKSTGNGDNEGATYSPRQHGLSCVFDVEAGSFRCIPLENVTQVEVAGKVYKVR